MIRSSSSSSMMVSAWLAPKIFFEMSPEIDSLASIRPGNAFSGVFGPSACFFIERTMQVHDGRDCDFSSF